MIFVTLGTQKFQFNRVLKQIDELINVGLISEDVYAQIGHSTYIPQKYKFDRFVDKDKFNECINSCNFVITHSGVATIIKAVSNGKPVIVVPRRKKYGEHVDDHQMQIATCFAENNYVMMCEETNDLLDCIDRIPQFKFEKYNSSRGEIIDLLDLFLSEIERGLL